MTDDDDERLRTALHESANAVAAFRLGHSVSLVTIVRSEDAAGRTWSHPTAVWDGMIDTRLPGILGLPDLRAFLERGIIIDVVGSIAGLGVPFTGYGRDPAADRAEEVAETLARLCRAIGSGGTPLRG